MTRECPVCHSKNPADASFCGQCGTPISKKTPSPPALESEAKSASSTQTAELPPGDFTPGFTFAGRYQVIEKLGEGGMGAIYKVWDKEVDATVALKLIKPEIAGNLRTINRFRNELKTARQISHKNICRMYDLDKEKNTYYITMEYMPGEDLKNMIGMTKRLSVATALDIAKQVCEGLTEAHRSGVVHRDIKPGNIMIGKQGQAKIMDFGLARSIKEEAKTDKGIIGTPDYISPEQVEGKRVDQRSDIYSLGVVLFEMLTGKLPFKEDSPLETALKHKTEAPPSPKKFNPRIPKELNRAILKCLEKNPEKRFQSTEELRAELIKIEGEIIPLKKRGSARIPKSYDAVSEWLKTHWILAAAFLGAAVIIGLILLFSGKEAPPALPQKSMLAVLPFENLGFPEDDYFVDGLTEEITNRLAALQELGVISRTSAILYKNTQKPIKEIGAELRVDYVLEGTVRWLRNPGGQDRVRVSAQLIRVSDDTHFWSDNYERILQDLFIVQSEIAEQIVKQLDIKIAEPERQALKARPTGNLQAYDLYLRAQERLPQAYNTQDRRYYEQVIALLEKAVQLDPKFTFAHLLLHQLQRTMYWVGVDRTEERLARSKAALDRALEIDPDLPEVKLALGYYNLRILQDHNRAIEILESVKRVRPNLPPLFLAEIQRDQGRWQDAILNFEKSFRLNPRSSDVAHILGRLYAWIGNYEESERWFNRALAITPTLYYSQLGLARVPFLARGDLKESRARLQALPQHRLTEYNWYLLGMMERNYQEILDRLGSMPYTYFGETNFYVPRDLALASIYHALNEKESATRYASRARAELEQAIQKSPEDTRFYTALGLAYAYLGNKARAIEEGKKALELNPTAKNAFESPQDIRNMAAIYTLVGEHDEALNQLEFLLSIPCGNYFSVSTLRLDPTWDPLRQNPRFERLLEENSKGTKFQIDPAKLAAARE